MIIDALNEKQYNIPANVPLNSEHKYVEAIMKEYPKYIEAIGYCGNFCMYNQLEGLFSLFNKNTNYSKSTIHKYTLNIIKDLEGLGFIGTEYLNKYKYIYLRQAGFAFITGDYKNNKRINKNSEMKTGRFLTSLLKLEYLLNYDSVFQYKTFNEQLTNVSKEILNAIINSGNKYRFDITTIRRIIEVGSYDGVKNIIYNTREKNTRLGIFRFIWGDLGKLYFKFGMQGLNIDNEPLYLKVNLLEDGNLTIHYAPKIIIFDKLKDLEHYRNQSNKFFHAYFELQNNKTQKMSEFFRNTGEFGYDHFNRIGYTIKIIGSNKEHLQSKIDILNIPYYEMNEYTPLVAPCDYVLVDTDKYFKYASKDFMDQNNDFSRITQNINEIIYTKKNNNDFKL